MYDESGHCIAKNEVTTGEPVEDYEYDSNGRLLRTRYYLKWTDDYFFIDENRYDENGLLTEVINSQSYHGMLSHADLVVGRKRV